MPILTVIAGPNGSGKSTVTGYIDFPGKENLFNPDAIAAELSPGNVAEAALAAGRVAIERRNRSLKAGIDFSIETTLAGNGVLALMRQAKASGFEIRLLFVAVDSAEISVRRVRERVSQGGHDVPPDEVRRRYQRSLANVPAAARLADLALIFDNSGDRHMLMLRIEQGRVTWRAPDLPEWTRLVVADLE